MKDFSKIRFELKKHCPEMASVIMLALIYFFSGCCIRPISGITAKGGKSEPMQKGKFEPTWESLKQYECPEWFRDVKFGIWAHWGPQCEPEQGDWDARNMY